MPQRLADGSASLPIPQSGSAIIAAGDHPRAVRAECHRAHGVAMRQRLAEWSAPKPRYATGVLGKYARLVSSASLGAVTG